MDDFSDVIYSSRVRLARNIKELPFPNRLRGEEEIYSVLMKGVKEACDKQFKSTFYKISDIDEIVGQTLIEKHLISPDLLLSPYGAVIISESEDVSVMINEEDHIREQCIVSGYRIDSAYNRVMELDSELESKLNIAKDEKYGYLTACPTNLGAGMRASVMLFLPALAITESLNSFIKVYQESGFTTRGVYGEGSKAQGYMYQISNQASIGYSEKEILARLNIVVRKLVEAERLARKNLADTRGYDLKDDIMRAYGILKYSFKITSEEFMEMLALAKLGVSLKYLDLDIDKLNQLTVMAQPAMLCFLAKKKLNAVERDIMRSALIKKML